jgi:SAM-dependent methyltransferase
MGDEPHQIRANRAVWNEKADKYAHPDSGLPNWGPFHVGRQDATLIGAMEGKRFLEIGFGAGYSIAYLIEHGAEHVTGIDFSDRQRELATERNRHAIDAGKVRLVQSPMEERISLDGPVDTVFSIFALGWSIDLAATLANAASYLKPGGRLVFSWEHPLFSITEFAEGEVRFRSPYFKTGEYEETGWQPGWTAFLHARTVAGWFAELHAAGFVVDRYLEPAPEHFSERQVDVANGQYYFRGRALIVPATMIFVCKKSI